MPYTGAGDPKLPENVQALPEARREQWVAVWNSAFEKCQKKGADDCEASAFRQANGVVFEKKSVEAQQPEKSTDDEKPAAEPDRFFVYKQADGLYRWASISSVAVKDKEFEIVTEKAQDDAIQHANDTGEFGELDLVHVAGTDVGDCDLMMRVGKRLIEGGTFRDTPLARGAIKGLEDDPDYWGTSIKFVYDPSKFDGEKYNGNIRIRKRTILPQEMAASFGTKLVAIGGEKPMNKEISDRARDTLQKLNVPEEDIDNLAEKQIEPEPNTVEKGDEAATEPEPETVEVEKSLWDRIKSAFSKPEPDADTGGEETAEVEPVAAQEEAKEVDLPEVVKGLFDAYTDATVEAVQSALAQRDKQIAILGEAVLALREQVKALQAPIEDAIEKRLAELPRVVKAAPSQTAVTDQVPARQALPYQNQVTTGDFVGELMKGVQGAVEQVARQFDQVQV
jgi:hypothetical protein